MKPTRHKQIRKAHFAAAMLAASLTAFCTNLGCSNIFKAGASKTTDDAYWEEAVKAGDASDWNTALTNLNLLSTEFKSRPAVIEYWAGAYAGKCGLNFTTFTTALSGASLTGSTLFKYFMNAFTQTTVSPGDCALAEAKMNEISSIPTNRTTSQNFFMLILGMAKIGAYLRYEGDRDSTSSLGDGTMDAGFNACTISATDLPDLTTNPGQYSDADIKQIVTGLGQILTNFSSVGASLVGGGASTALDSMIAACALLPAPNPCTITDVASVTAPTVTLMRELIHTGPTTPSMALGIGACGVAPGTTACCGL